MLKLLLLGAVSAWTGVAQTPVSVFVVDTNGSPLKGVSVDGMTYPTSEQITSSTGRFEGATTSPRLAVRKPGFQAAIIPPQKGITIVLRPATRSPIPRCPGPTDEARRFSLPKAKKYSKLTDIDYHCDIYAVRTKTGKHFIRHCSGPLWGIGYPTNHDLRTSTEYTEESHFENGIELTQARGRSAKGAYWRYLGVFGESITYKTTDPQVLPQLDALFDSACLSTR